MGTKYFAVLAFTTSLLLYPSSALAPLSSPRFQPCIQASIRPIRFANLVQAPFSSTKRHRNNNNHSNDNNSNGRSFLSTTVLRASLLSNSSNDKGDQGREKGSKTSISLETRIDNTLHKLQNIPPWAQLVLLMMMYIIHLLVLTQHAVLLPFQLLPNDRGWFQSIGLDSIAGIISFISIGLLRRRQIARKQKVTIPSLFSGVYDYQIVESLSKRNRKIASSPSSLKATKPTNNPDEEIIVKKRVKKRSKTSIPSPWRFPLKKQENIPSPRLTSMVALTLLVSAYFMTGRLASMIELYLYTLAGLGVPMTIAMHRSLVVLGGHLAWVAIGSGILGMVLRPQPFFGGGNELFVVESNNQKKTTQKGSNSINTTTNDDVDNDDDNDDDDEEVGEIEMKKQKYKWYSNRWNSNWLWWTIGGYFISSWFFNIADFLNQVILPSHVFELAGEGVVSQLINPENNDFLASLVGYIAPCLSAPWWEEVLYRGFLLPALTLQMKFWPAVFVSGVVFSIHHVSATGAIPLAILGWTWAAIYAKSGNLMVTILIHAMWNSRVFLGSWLGL